MPRQKAKTERELLLEKHAAHPDIPNGPPCLAVVGRRACGKITYMVMRGRRIVFYRCTVGHEFSKAREKE